MSILIIFFLCNKLRRQNSNKKKPEIQWVSSKYTHQISKWLFLPEWSHFTLAQLLPLISHHSLTRLTAPAGLNYLEFDARITLSSHFGVCQCYQHIVGAQSSVWQEWINIFFTVEYLTPSPKFSVLSNLMYKPQNPSPPRNFPQCPQLEKISSFSEFSSTFSASLSCHLSLPSVTEFISSTLVSRAWKQRITSPFFCMATMVSYI